MNLDKTRLIHDIMIKLHFLVVFNMLPNLEQYLHYKL